MRVLLVALVIVALLGASVRCARRRRPRRRCRVWRLRPRTPDDCPRCRCAAGPLQAANTPTVSPWRQGRSRRGAPRRVSTEGYSCRQPACPYCGSTDAAIHALVADGYHGRSDHIQRFRCQACGHTVTARFDTALYRLKTPPQRIGEVLAASAEGLDIGAAVRVFGHGEATITRWRDRAAAHSDRVHHRFLRGLHLPHLQRDEIRVRLRVRHRVTWLWLALDPATKLIPALALGPRTQQTAHDLVHPLRSTLAHGCVPVVTTDGLRLYFYALTAHFGRWVTVGRRRRWRVDPALLYGQVQEHYRHRRLVRVRRWAVCGRGGRLRAALRWLGWTGVVQTAFIERLNLTARQSVAALTRRTWATVHGDAGVQRQVAWWRAYYHVVRPHRSLRHLGRACTPAMAAGLTTHRWTALEVLTYPCARAA